MLAVLRPVLGIVVITFPTTATAATAVKSSGDAVAVSDAVVWCREGI